MPVQAYNISHQFDNGNTLFQHLSCSMTKNRVGLVGCNGVGKSILASILSGERKPSGGTVTLPKSLAVYRQLPSHLFSAEFSIAQFLGKDNVLEALKQVESGDCSEQWFNTIGDQWDLSIRLTQWLKKMGLPSDPHFPCAQLSGGQLARLQLWQLFESDVELLILDEPSNHLDTYAKQWLVATMRAFEGAILLISHDRFLLREMEEIWELSGLGLQVFGGNYDVYAEQKCTALQAVERQISSINKQKKKLQAQAQRNREKAEQRASQGNKLRKKGSQATILLNEKKDKATARASNRNKNEQLRQSHLLDKEQQLKMRKEPMKGQKFYLEARPNRLRRVVSIIDGVLPFGSTEPITLQVYAHDKLHIMGQNGCGKSTLLKTILGQLTLQQGILQINTPLYYLDQHFGSICPDLSILDNLVQQCDGMKESEARILLAGIGFRRDSVFRPGFLLSDGEKMKLAMLIVSHQPEQPLLLLDEPDSYLDLGSKHMLAEALQKYRSGFMLISHDHDFVCDSGVKRQTELSFKSKQHYIDES